MDVCRNCSHYVDGVHVEWFCDCVVRKKKKKSSLGELIFDMSPVNNSRSPRGRLGGGIAAMSSSASIDMREWNPFDRGPYKRRKIHLDCNNILEQTNFPDSRIY